MEKKVVVINRNGRRSKRREKRRKKIILILIIIIVIAILAGLGLSYYIKQEKDLVYSEAYVEAGSAFPDVSEFLKREETDVAFSEDNVYDMKVPGDYQLTILWQMPVLGEQSYSTVLHVVDTTAPTVTAVESASFFDYEDSEKDPMSLIESITDVTECTAEFAKEYDFTQAGDYELEVVVTDTSGNSTSVTVPCTIIHDDTPPVISGVTALTVHMGDAISYMENVTVSDDYDDDPTLEVDTSNVNTDKQGTYTIIYKATDKAGNTSTKKTNIVILAANLSNVTSETVYEMADEVLDEIFTEGGLSKKEKAQLIYNWVVDNITYSYSTGYDDKISGAYVGFTSRRGDCTVLQKTAEVLLNRAGITVMEIEKIRDSHGGHAWLLIDIGEGWYHFDPTRMEDGSLIFYWTDAQLKEHNATDGMNHHNYDASKYPTIQ